ncbi:MAG: hypothetical protein H2057_01275 [Alphaproteobacteria bacterium]|nr:hypothetical protein [Alphaproteobacteria bacterium]
MGLLFLVTKTRVGLWDESEIFVTLFYFSSALTAFFALLLRPRALSHALCTPPLLCLITLFFISALASLVHPVPGADWFGPPETGIGIFMWAATALLAAGFGALLVSSYQPLLWIGTLATTLLAGICLSAAYGQHSTIQTHNFNSFLGYAGITLLVCSRFFKDTVHRYSCLIIGALTIIFSKNATTLLGMGALIPLLWFFDKFKDPLKRRLQILSLIATPFSVAAAEHLFSSPARFPSLWSRVLSHYIVLFDLKEHPWIWAWGRGWGSFTEQLFAQYPKIGGTFIQNGQWHPNWDALQRFDFHSHNGFLEALSAVGILGPLLLLGFYSALVGCAPAHKRTPAYIFSFLHLITTCNWFELPLTFPYTAFAIALVLAPSQKDKHREPTRPRLLIFGTLFGLLASMSLLWASFANMRLSLENNGHPDNFLSRHLTLWYPLRSPQALYLDDQRGGRHLAERIDAFVGRNLSEGISSSLAFKLEFMHWMDSALVYHPQTLRLLRSELYLFKFLYLDLKDDTRFRLLRQKYQGQWQNTLTRFLALGPDTGEQTFLFARFYFQSREEQALYLFIKSHPFLGLTQSGAVCRKEMMSSKDAAVDSLIAAARGRVAL